MNIYEAANTGKPFAHPDMIGAYCIIDGKHWVHRDNVKDFDNLPFIRQHCLGYFGLWGVCVDDLLREDWFLIG